MNDSRVGDKDKHTKLTRLNMTVISFAEIDDARVPSAVATVPNPLSPLPTDSFLAYRLRIS
jgi:hypothetical protein